LGSTAYPKFCAFGKWLDLALKRLDGTRLVQVGLGDELGDRVNLNNLCTSWVNFIKILQAAYTSEKVLMH